MSTDAKPVAAEPSQTVQESPSSSGTDDNSGKRECPICVMMREGGCEQQFQGFMNCGVEAEKGDREYNDCIKMFESLRECMTKNPAVFGELMKDMDDAGMDGKPKGASKEQ